MGRDDLGLRQWGSGIHEEFHRQLQCSSASFCCKSVLKPAGLMLRNLHSVLLFVITDQNNIASACISQSIFFVDVTLGCFHHPSVAPQARWQVHDFHHAS